MRILLAIPLLVTAACGSNEAEKNTAAPARAATVAAGQYALVSEVTALTNLDGGQARIDTPPGTRAEYQVCVGGDRPDPVLFTGEDYDCDYKDYYARNGRMNVTLECTRDGLSWNINIMSDGEFTADGVEFTRELGTQLSTEGDVRISARVTGRRTGDCTPDAGDTEGNIAADNAAG